MVATHVRINPPASTFLSIFRFSFRIKRDDFRVFEVVAHDYGEACVSACAACSNNDSLFVIARRSMPGVMMHALRGAVLDANEQRLLLLFPLDPRD